MNELAARVWVPLQHSPLLWITVTLSAWLVARRIQTACKGALWANPVLIAVALLIGLLVVTGTPYATYFEGAKFIHFLLGPATVALGVPLARNLHHVRRSLFAVAAAIAAGSVTAVVSGVLIVRALGGSRALAMAMAPKAATTPIAMDVAAQIGGSPALAAALAIAGGIVAAIAGSALLGRLKIDDWRAHGLSAGVAGSGIAAAQAASLDGLAAAFGALGLALNGLVTSIVALAAPWM